MKLISVLVTARAKKSRIVELAGPPSLKVYVAAPAVDGKANEGVVKLLADWFRVKKRDVRIVRGQRSRQKIIEIKGL